MVKLLFFIFIIYYYDIVLYRLTELTAVVMSVTKTKERWFRMYTADRKMRKPVGANTLEELITEGI